MNPSRWQKVQFEPLGPANDDWDDETEPTLPNPDSDTLRPSRWRVWLGIVTMVALFAFWISVWLWWGVAGIPEGCQ